MIHMIDRRDLPSASIDINVLTTVQAVLTMDVISITETRSE